MEPTPGPTPVVMVVEEEGEGEEEEEEEGGMNWEAFIDEWVCEAPKEGVKDWTVADYANSPWTELDDDDLSVEPPFYSRLVRQ
jgi:rubredoxin